MTELHLNEENCSEIISSYSIKNWKPLLDLIPKIEATEKFEEEYIEKLNNEDGTINLPHIFGTEIVDKFHDIVYNIPIIISFDWGTWDEGRKMVDDRDFDFNTIDIPSKCKLITAIVRNDRFCEGALVSAFESGLMQKILKSIETQLGNSE